MAYDRVIVWECLFVALMVLLFMMGIIVPFLLRGINPVNRSILILLRVISLFMISQPSFPFS